MKEEATDPILQNEWILPKADVKGRYTSNWKDPWDNSCDDWLGYPSRNSWAGRGLFLQDPTVPPVYAKK